MRKILCFRTLCVSLGIWVGTLVVSAQAEFKALPWRQSTAYNSYLMRDVHRQFADRDVYKRQANGSIADTTGVLSNFMKTVGFDIPEYKEGTPSGDYLLVGAFEPPDQQRYSRWYDQRR